MASHRQEAFRMAKTMRCNDVVGNCDFVAHGESEQEIMDQAGEHARTAHQVEEITPEMAEKVRGAIRDEAA
jgi:predicted small metal-binding protein